MTGRDGAADSRPAAHYDRVTAAWRYLLGENLHYGLFRAGTESLDEATEALTSRMAQAVRVFEGADVLDVGCGTGAPACRLAKDFGACVTGITTSEIGVAAASARAAAAGVSDRTRFVRADGMRNGLPDASFDCVWALESAHLMADRPALVAECARVLRPGGRVALCDVMRRREIPFLEVRERRAEFQLLRRVFGDARLESLEAHRELMTAAGLIIEGDEDLSAATAPTFDRWRANAVAHHEDVARLLGPGDYAAFVAATRVLESLWADGTLGYGLVVARRPA